MSIGESPHQLILGKDRLSKVNQSIKNYTRNQSRIPLNSGLKKQKSFTGSKNGIQFSHGTRRMSYSPGSKAARLMFPTIASTDILKKMGTKLPLSGRVSQK